VALTDSTVEDRLRAFVEREQLDVARTETLVGEASNRAYSRFHLVDGSCRVAALLPEPFEPASLPFLNVRELFAAIPLRVPEVFVTDGPNGVLLLEDLGDALLQDAVEGASPSDKAGLYREALEMLARLQLRGAELDSPRFSAFQVAFDAEKFRWELDFFQAHFLEGLLGASLDDAERAVLDRDFARIASELASAPFVLCHRDFHARNLMLFEGELAVIDFQDARKGPAAYDVVSLLSDSYVSHEPDFVEEMVDFFEQRTKQSISESYDIAALQRNIKALGTFGYQIARRDNAVYRRYLAQTVSLVDRNLSGKPRFRELRNILTRHCEQNLERLK